VLDLRRKPFVIPLLSGLRSDFQDGDLNMFPGCGVRGRETTLINSVLSSIVLSLFPYLLEWQAV